MVIWYYDNFNFEWISSYREDVPFWGLNYRAWHTWQMTVHFFIFFSRSKWRTRAQWGGVPRIRTSWWRNTLPTISQHTCIKRVEYLYLKFSCFDPARSRKGFVCSWSGKPISIPGFAFSRYLTWYTYLGGICFYSGLSYLYVWLVVCDDQGRIVTWPLIWWDCYI